MIYTIAFQLEKPVSSSYELPVDWTEPYNPELLVVIDRDPDEDYSLTQSERFYYQVSINRNIRIALNNMSLHGVPYLDRESMRKYNSISWSYGDTQDFDKTIMTSYDSLTRIYAVVVVKDGKYTGHVYAWVSPNNPSLLLIIGIQSRVDNIFVKSYSEYLPNISKYLIDRCRILALDLGCTSLVTVWPLGSMVPILQQMGFIKIQIRKSDLSLSLLSLDEMNDNTPDEREHYGITNLSRSLL